MNQNSMIAVIGVIILLSAGCIGVFAMMNKDSDSGLDLSKDAAGRNVAVPENLDDGIVAIGVGTARWVTYFGLEDKIVLRDYRDNNNFFGKSYMYAAGIINKKPASAGAGIQDADAQTILGLSPSLVILSKPEFDNGVGIVNALEKAGINVLVIYELEEMIDTSFSITEKFEYQTKLLGKVFDKEGFAGDFLDNIRGIVSDIRTLAASRDPVKGYIGGLAYSGTKGVDSTSGTYLPFLLANVTNVISGSDFAAEKSVSDITAAVTPDTVVFIDDSAKKITKEGSDPTQKSLVEVFNAKGVKGYSVMPYIYFGLNFENVLIAAYQIISCVYADVLNETQLNTKIDSVFDTFYRTHLSMRTTVSSGVDSSEPGTVSIYNDIGNVFVGSTSANGLGMKLCERLIFNSDGRISSAS